MFRRFRCIRFGLLVLPLVIAFNVDRIEFPVSCCLQPIQNYVLANGLANSRCFWHRRQQTTLAISTSPNQPDDEYNEYDAKKMLEASERLRDAAQQLRLEISEFEQQKELSKRQEESLKQQLQQEQEQQRLRYSAVLPIAKPDGSEVMERIFFRAWWPLSSSSSTVIACEIKTLPLGVVLSEHENFVGAITVDEILQDDGWGVQGGLQVGDLVRACTACRFEMERPTWQLLAGGIGRPKTRRYIYDVDGRPLEEVLEAIRSNRLDPEQRPILLVVERLHSATTTTTIDESQ